MARPVKSYLLHLIYITAKTTTDDAAAKVAGGQATSDNIYEAYTYTNGIIKQETSRGYYVQTSNGASRVRLVASDTPAYKEAFIKATDDNGNTYFVTKLTAHKATLVQWTQHNTDDWIYEDGQTAEWTFNSTADGKVVIENND